MSVKFRIVHQRRLLERLLVADRSVHKIERLDGDNERRCRKELCKKNRTATYPFVNVNVKVVFTCTSLDKRFTRAKTNAYNRRDDHSCSQNYLYLPRRYYIFMSHARFI